MHYIVSACLTAFLWHIYGTKNIGELMMEKIPTQIKEAEAFCDSLTNLTDKNTYTRDSKIVGLLIRTTPAGKKAWQLRYNIKKGEKWCDTRASLGKFKKASKDKNYASEGLTVSEARQLAANIKADIKANNTDPNNEKKQKAIDRLAEQQRLENERLQLITLNDLFERWDKAVISHHKDGGARVRNVMQSKVLDKYGNLSVSDFSKKEILAITDTLLNEGKQRMAKVTFSLIRQMMRFAETRDIIEADPTHKVDKKQIGGADKERNRVLCSTDDKPDELKELIKKIPHSGLKDTSQAGLFICLATACRIGELLKAKWEHVDIENRYWIIPSENSKNGKQHSIYLNDFALEYFKKLKNINELKEEKSRKKGKPPHTDKTVWSEWLFPNNKTNEEEQSHVETRNITKQVSDRQKAKEAVLSKRTVNCDALKLPCGKWTPHDLRRTSATLMVELGVMPEVVERCLNHAEDNKVKRTYQRYSYKPQMKQAWELLGDRLIVLRDGGDNVITLKQNKETA
tara:strand:- start:7961 stop:9502 length:1542 start_codon:yes stop_codon:yes gene_type:complete